MSGGGSSNKIIKHQNEQIKKQYKYDQKQYAYQYGLKYDKKKKKYVQQFNKDGTKKGVVWDKYDYAKEKLELQKESDKQNKAYQEETANQNWEQGKSMQDFQWAQEDAIYNKNIEQYESQIDLNELEYQNALEREQTVLDEKFIESAYQNQSLIQDLYEQTGTAGFEEAKLKLGLQSREENIEYQTQKSLTNLKQQTESAEFDTGRKQLDLLDTRGSADYQTAQNLLDLGAKEAETSFKKATLNLDTKTQQQALEFQNSLLRREQNKNALDTARTIQEEQIKALQASGQAQLTQAGRSQGKAVSMIMAGLERNSGYLAETLIRGQDMANARIKQNQITSLNKTQRAALEEQKLEYDSIKNVSEAMMSIQEIDRSLKMSDSKTQIDINEIQKGVLDTLEMTNIDTKKLEDDLLSAQLDTGIQLDQIDFNLDNLGTRFEQNQDILQSSLQSAVKAAEMNKEDLLLAKTQADITAEARKGIDPSTGREDIDLANFKPIPLPDPIYQDPMKPNVGPPPIKGATQSLNTMGDVLPGAAITGAIAGIGAGVAAAGSSSAAIASAAGPIGWAVGGLTFLGGLL